MSGHNINQLLEKTADWDKDERYMATSDLCTELQKDIKIDAALERRICAAILKQLDDKSNDVQSIAVKCLGIILKKVQEAQVGDISDKLCALILDGSKAELRDIYSIGLKTLIADVPDHMGGVVARLTPRLIGGITQDEVVEVKLECIDILSDVLKRFGRQVEPEHERLMSDIITQLSHSQAVVRKRATACVGALSVVVGDGLFNRLLENLLSQMEARRENEARTVIQTVSTISRHSGYRLGRHLDRIVPLFLRFCGDPDDENTHNEQWDELRENCMQSFESFVSRCPREVKPHIGTILDTVLVFMKYDPNYNYGDSEGEDDMEQDEDDEEFSDDDADYSNDEDTAWKVRRGAVKVLSAIISSRVEVLSELYARTADHMIGRFKEREENVRVDMIMCFTELLRCTMLSDRRANTGEEGPAAPPRALRPPRLVRQRSSEALLEERIPALVNACVKQMKDKSVKPRSATFGLLRQLAEVAPGQLGPHLARLLPETERHLHDRNSGLKLEALQLTRLLFATHSPSEMQPHVASLVGPVAACVREEWYKIIAEALRVVGCMVQTVRPLDAETGMFTESGFDASPFVSQLYEAVLPRLSAHDIDQEIKECAITSMGLILSHFGDSLTDQLAAALPLLMDRLGNEITRMPTLRTLAAIAHSPLRVDLTPVLSEAMSELSHFLRQQSRALKQAALDTLNALVESNGSHMSGEVFATVLSEVAALVSDADLHLSHLALRLVRSVLATSPAAAPTVQSQVLPKALALAVSPVLQGHALKSLMAFYEELVKTGAAGLGFEQLLAALLEPITNRSTGVELPKQSIANTARCIAVLCVHAPAGPRDNTIARFVAEVRQPTSSELQKHVALLSLGEVGHQMDLSQHADLQTVILSSFESGSEEVKAAAAYALGNIAVGNMTVYLPVLVQALGAGGNEYLLLSALKEVIAAHTCQAELDFTPHVESVLPILFAHCESPEEGVRNMVSDCLGKLSTVAPAMLLPALAERASSADAMQRWTAVTALKYAMAMANLPTQELGPRMPEFLSALQDQELDVRRAAMHMLNAAAHHQPHLIQELLAPLVFPTLYEALELKLERVVDLGPFKHRVDDGLPLRKAAFAVVDTLLDVLPERLDTAAFLPRLCAGLTDHDDVQMLCHQMLGKMCVWAPTAVLSALDALVDPLDKTVNKKAKDSQVGTEVERANDLVRSALRAVDALQQLPDATLNRKFQDFSERIQKRDKLADMLAVIRAERSADER